MNPKDMKRLWELKSVSVPLQNF